MPDTWDYIDVTLQYALPILSLAFLVMATIRYFGDGDPADQKKRVRRAFLAYGIHPLPMAILATILRILDPGADMDRFVVCTAIVVAGLTVLLLLTCIFFGFKSRTKAGTRMAMSGAAIMIAYVLFPQAVNRFINFVLGGRLVAVL